MSSSRYSVCKSNLFFPPFLPCVSFTSLTSFVLSFPILFPSCTCFLSTSLFSSSFLPNPCLISLPLSLIPSFLSSILPLPTLPHCPLLWFRRGGARSRSLPASCQAQTSTLCCHGELGPSAPIIQWEQRSWVLVQEVSKVSYFSSSPEQKYLTAAWLLTSDHPEGQRNKVTGCCCCYSTL